MAKHELEAREGEKILLRTAGEKLSWVLMEAYGTHYPKSRWSLASWQLVGLGLKLCFVWQCGYSRHGRLPRITCPLTDPGSS